VDLLSPPGSNSTQFGRSDGERALRSRRSTIPHLSESAATFLVMAAGEGTRMRSSVPKVLHTVCGRPMVAWPVLAAREAGAERIAVISSPGHDLSPGLPPGTETVLQPKPDGTGGAIRAALDLITDAETVVVLSGDHPLISAETIAGLLETHRQADAAATVMTTLLEEPGTYGRIIRGENGAIERIVEAKAPGDATAEELEIREVNTGTYVFAAERLAAAVGQISNDNAQGEYYLGDVIPAMRSAGLRIAAHVVEDEAVNLGVNTRADLARAEAVARERILERHMLAGATITDPASTWIDADVELGEDVRIDPGCSLRGATSVGGESVVGPHTTLIDTTVGRRVTVPHSYLSECVVQDGCDVGPFAHIRPQTTLGEGAKAGAFVEIKNAQIGERAKVPHLSYVGDADVGPGSNLGAGAITANYDGFRKHRTVIGAHARIGVDTMLIAPVEVGESAYTGGGSVITDDVPPGALGISRAPQENVEGFAERKAAEAETEDGS
jgi:bifunctional UDP-N-acetylglucosamine pyrophosphorylase / glucosamine-1-phosphate N-acetyltransferase